MVTAYGDDGACGGPRSSVPPPFSASRSISTAEARWPRSQRSTWPPTRRRSRGHMRVKLVLRPKPKRVASPKGGMHRRAKRRRGARKCRRQGGAGGWPERLSCCCARRSDDAVLRRRHASRRRVLRCRAVRQGRRHGPELGGDGARCATVISNNEDLINNPEMGDKHLTGIKSSAKRSRCTEKRPVPIRPRSTRTSHQGRLMHAMMNAIVEVMNDNQETINEKGTGFKGFIPAVFGRLVSESFNGSGQGRSRAEDHRTARSRAQPQGAARRLGEPRSSRPSCSSPDWPSGQPYSATVSINGRPAYRFAVPEYYTASPVSPATARPRASSTLPAIQKRGASSAISAGS